jgi:phosphatidylinositol-3-phosphatase
MRALRVLGRSASRVFALLAVGALTASHLAASAAAAATPKPQHVFIIVLENEGYHLTFGPNSPALYLNALARKGALLENYYGIGHNSLDNYIAMISGQAPNPITQGDCYYFAEFGPPAPMEDGQAVGTGCVYPPNVSTIADQLDGKTLNWKGYMEDMGNSPSRESATCGHPVVGQQDGTQKAQKGDQYASRHDPFVYFHKIIDDPSGCAAHVVNLSALATDLQDIKTTPNYAYITPNLCHDGHDAPCVDDQPGGLISADKFLEDVVPKILNSAAYKEDGLLIVTFDEADTDQADVENFEACCHEPRGPNIKSGAMVVYYNPPGTEADKGPGITGPGGGRIGAVLLSRFIEAGTKSDVPYNHYSLLRSIEDFFDVGHLGYAGQTGLKPFGKDVFTKPNG